MTEETFLEIRNRIRPYRDEEVPRVIAELLAEPSFQAFLRIFPRDIATLFLSRSSQVATVRDFKVELMAPLIRRLIQATTFSYDMSGKSNLKGYDAVTFLSNHRDIILDSAILNLCLIDSDLPLARIAIGDNLFAKPFIGTMVRLADSIVVERGLPPRAFIESSQVFSSLVDESIQREKRSLWIAHREGRAKDSDDRTQPALLKMLALSGGESSLENLFRKNIVPMTISYEYDPCDYLKAREMLTRQSGSPYRKEKGEDLNSMKQGLLGQKGRIHIDLATPLRELLRAEEERTPIRFEALAKSELFEQIARLVDREIHQRYRLYPGNYIAEDLLARRLDGLHQGHYSEADVERFSAYLEERIALAQPRSDEEKMKLRELILLQYANPLRNRGEALSYL